MPVHIDLLNRPINPIAAALLLTASFTAISSVPALGHIDRLVLVTNPLDHETSYTWDANNNLISQTNARDHTTSFTYDDLDHLLSRTYPNSTTETFGHDAHGNRTVHTDANGQVRTFGFDALDRLESASYPAATDSEASQVAYEYDGNGNRTEVTEQVAAGGTRTTTFRYDSFDRLDRETDRFGQTVTHHYDLKGNRTRRDDATGTTHFDIDDLDRIERIRAPGRGPVQYHYSDAGRVEQIDHPDGTRTDQTFDAAGRIESIGHFRSGEREAFYEYGYDLNGNRSSQIEDLGTGEVETTYTYDEADRLIETERAGRVTEYVLDEVGNRIEERTTDAGSTTTKVLSYNERNQLQTIETDGLLVTEYDYDANGNRIEAATNGLTRHFTFGARDRLKSLHLQGGPPDVEWEYDDAGFRVSETTSAEARRFRWDGEKLAFETNVLGNLLSRYDHGPDRLLAETEGGSTRTWLTDALRTPVKRLNDNGTVYSVTRYDEFGKVEEESSPDTPRFGFTGHQRGPQEEPDLYYAQQRWYNAATGRFLSEDPLWGQPETPLSLHRYLYAYANPTVYWDPDGEDSIEINVVTCQQDGTCSLTSTAGDALHFLQSSQMNSPEQGDALREAQLRSSLFGFGRTNSNMVTQPLMATGAGQFEEPYIVHGSSRALTRQQQSISFKRDLGLETNYVPYGRGIEAAGVDAVYGLPPVMIAQGAMRAANAESPGEFALGIGEVALGVVPSAFALRHEARSLSASADAALLDAMRPRGSQSRFLSESANGRVIFDPAFSPELLMMRTRASTGDMNATRTLVAQDMVDGLSRVQNSGHAIRGEGGRFVSNEMAAGRSGQPPIIQPAQLVDPSVAAANGSMHRLSPIIDGGDMARMPARTRSGGVLERALHLMDRLNEDARLRESIKDGKRLQTRTLDRVGQ